MRVVLAGIFVWLAVISIALIAVFVVPANIPPLVGGVGMAIAIVISLLAAFFLFNKKRTSLNGTRDKQEYLKELEAKGLIIATGYRAKRAFQPDEDDDEGCSYYVELDDNSVLYLSGQYLYEYELFDDDDPEMMYSRRFPCTEFVIKRHRKKGWVVDIACEGEILEPEVPAPGRLDEDFKSADLPRDGEVIRNRSYDQIKSGRTV